ncbi:hypothetical protein [Arenibacterium sp. LLYu02]|uniref:hypothetical protein n=1 Tax=Arenibacterium sp. LLYu02 TaxID=3404132 RepID=UPI003B21A2B2
MTPAPNSAIDALKSLAADPVGTKHTTHGGRTHPVRCQGHHNLGSMTHHFGRIGTLQEADEEISRAQAILVWVIAGLSTLLAACILAFIANGGASKVISNVSAAWHYQDPGH